jgi:hypothetical protein
MRVVSFEVVDDPMCFTAVTCFWLFVEPAVYEADAQESETVKGSAHHLSKIEVYVAE